MSTPATKVELGVDLSSVSGTAFTLDSATEGVLGEDVLGGLTYYDISEYVLNCSVKRGRSTQLDYFNAGTAQILLNNRDRTFDPLNEDSPYYPEIKPRRLIRISTNDIRIFVGVVNDWDIDYDLVDNDTATMYCSDVFSFLANMNLSAFTPATQLTSARIDNVLDRPEVDYQGGREINSGTVNVGNYAVPADTNVLNYLRQIERSEYGSLFVSSDGNIVFRPRGFFFGDVTVFADDGTGIPYSSLSNQFGDELLYNRIVLQSPAGSSTKSDTASITEYQISQLSWTDLLNSSTTDLSDLADYLLDKLSTPRLRFNNISLQLSGQSLDVVSTVLNLDMGSYCSLVKSFAVGTPSSVTQPSIISGISHVIRPDSHIVSFDLEFWYEDDVFIVGDSIRGVLDSSFTLV